MSHTPGPWKSVYAGVDTAVFSEDDRTFICRAAHDEARLIAAAPDLLAVCKAVAGVFLDIEDRPLYAQKCLAAIAKAEGK